MKIKKQFYKLSKEEFDKYLDGLKKAPDTLFFLEKAKEPYFYCLMRDTLSVLNELLLKKEEFERLYQSFSGFGQRQLLQSFFIDEIESTNKIENIYSTKHDIFSVMKQVKGVKDKKIVSVVNSYQHILQSDSHNLKTLDDIGKLYDTLILPSLAPEDKPDGKYFRKGDVYISDGITHIHRGVSGEENINLAMREFLELYNSDLEIMEKMILCHFIFETTHPYYDGNGRMGRFLFSYGLYQKTKSVFTFKIAMAFSRNKKKYYSAFKNASKDHEFGCLNGFVEDIAQLLIDELDITIKDITLKKDKIETLKKPFKFKKSEDQIYNLLTEGSILSDFGLSNTEIQEETNLSKATVDKAIKHFKNLGILESTRFGYYVFHKIIK
ncbi:MAG TPA: Fic family protein [Mogibacterium sp.]|nr:Fic family protein [Mogibacterium sp.]